MRLEKLNASQTWTSQTSKKMKPGTRLLWLSRVGPTYYKTARTYKPLNVLMIWRTFLFTCFDLFIFDSKPIYLCQIGFQSGTLIVLVSNLKKPDLKRNGTPVMFCLRNSPSTRVFGLLWHIHFCLSAISQVILQTWTCQTNIQTKTLDLKILCQFILYLIVPISLIFKHLLLKIFTENALVLFQTL